MHKALLTPLLFTLFVLLAACTPTPTATPKRCKPASHCEYIGSSRQCRRPNGDCYSYGRYLHPMPSLITLHAIFAAC